MQSSSWPFTLKCLAAREVPIPEHFDIYLLDHEAPPCDMTALEYVLNAAREEMERLKAAFVKKFQWITMEIGQSHSYLGMNITLYDGYSTVDMIHFIEKMLRIFLLLMTKRFS